ncbi:ABC transporter substrate-binding protein [Halosolutus gelatinilyticus]|uniref:ABC transporter substrate-binding protein n=1 Tax=Halosolutus gelatinilyticus TaxID=2931975 RepID=UPI001FF325CE|nr:ABC transporter substrate-binding protein [Halosolutus gelatinilyticus]
MGVKRRNFLGTVGATVGIAGLAGCSGTSNSGVTLGLLIPSSGSFSLTGQEVRRGAEMASKHLGGEIDGMDLGFIERDTGSEPDGALEGARELVREENVDAIIGPSSSASAQSVLPYIHDQAQVPILPTQASSVDARTGDNCTEYSFFIWPSNRHTAPVGVEFIYDLPGHIDRDFNPDEVHFVSPDYALGQNNQELVEEEMAAQGGEVTGSTLVPIGTQDLSSYLAEIQDSDADVVTGVLTPDMATRLINQAADFGLAEEKILMFNSGKPVDQLTQASVGETASGWFGTTFYDPTSDSEINQAFQDLYPSDSDLLPNTSCGSGFEPVRAVATAVEQTGSTDADDLTDELSGLEWDSIFGPAMFREGDGQIELNFTGAARDGTEFLSLEEYNNVIPENSC